MLGVIFDTSVKLDGGPGSVEGPEAGAASRVPAAEVLRGAGDGVWPLEAVPALLWLGSSLLDAGAC
jgi:hypothetical protein